MKALVVVQAFPPLLKNAGGVAKRYLSLCRALIDGLGWQVTLLTPVDVTQSGEKDVNRWLESGALTYLPARGVRIYSVDGTIVTLDLFSFVNTGYLVRELLLQGKYDCVFADDLGWRFSLLLVARAAGVPAVVTTHTDATHMKGYKGVFKLVWRVHMASARLAAVHATVSRVFGDQMRSTYKVPVNGVWPPILWAAEFRSDPSEWAERAALRRQEWLAGLRAQGCTPKAILLSAGRWSAEKRIHLLLDVVPEDCALVIVGDGTSDYSDTVAAAGPQSGRPHVLPLRRMLNASELRIAYAASDLFLSASNFETLGNTIIEAWCSGTPVAVQPEQGHLEFVKDSVNSWFVNYDDQSGAKAALARIVASGLDSPALAASLPELAPTSERFRQADFARDFEAAIISPALAVGQRQRVREVGCMGGCAEALRRSGACFAWAFSWLALRLTNRCFYMCSRDPKCEVLGKLGSAVEAPSQLKPGIVPALPPRGPSDYEAHFRRAPSRKNSFFAA